VGRPRIDDKNEKAGARETKSVVSSILDPFAYRSVEVEWWPAVTFQSTSDFSTLP
jgi:hypothetical protein